MSKAQTRVSETDKKIECSALIGWLLAGNNPGAKIINAPIYSISAAYVRNPQVMYELNVNSFFSKIKYVTPAYNDTSVRYSQTYIMFGIVRVFQTEIPNFIPYLSATIGFANTSIKTSNTAPSPMQLAAGLLGGIKVDLNARVGLKFQVRVQSPLAGLGMGVGISTGGPTVGIGSYSNTIQFDASAGLFFRL